MRPLAGGISSCRRDFRIPWLHPAPSASADAPHQPSPGLPGQMNLRATNVTLGGATPRPTEIVGVVAAEVLG